MGTIYWVRKIWTEQDSSPEAEQGTGATEGKEDKMEQEICDLTTKVKIADDEPTASGIPEFWLTTLRNVEILDDQIYEWDYPALKHLEDIKIVFPDSEGLNYIIEFYFSPNSFFSDHVLTKWYTVKCDVDPNDPFQFNGPEIVNCNGCEIHWQKGKNLTKKLKKKKQRSKGRGQSKVINKLVPQESFFNFFSPPNIPDDLSLLDDEQGAAIELDFTLAEMLKERVIPKAVLYFTGEILQSGESSQIDDSSVDTSISADEEFNKANKHIHFNHYSDSDNGNDNSKNASGEGAEKPPECDKQVQ
ncbi:Nucleosome assembly protein 1-like 1 [Oopsacas minuta]|uniref:Nucleosome assembly protein 1-like 1 n=1 Tax=Oopsacas minuta TaxID=111878 RepID=A0AAV7JJ18_9METZ|nr:Nucleosome assembly protein 1-like 1 [Oopsacas minuta]